MSKKLIFIGGAPGVGKSTVARLLLNDLENCVWLDGDDLWRMNPFIVDDSTKKMVENNISFVLNSFIQAQFSYIIFTWVLHMDSIVNAILSSIDLSGYDFRHYALTCDEKTLKERHSIDVDRATDFLLAVKRLEQSKDGKSLKIDTVGKTPLELATILRNEIKS